MNNVIIQNAELNRQDFLNCHVFEKREIESIGVWEHDGRHRRSIRKVAGQFQSLTSVIDPHCRQVE